MNEEERRGLADYTVDNSGDLQTLQGNVSSLIAELWQQQV
jgi:dephospho-CoA kinase